METYEPRIHQDFQCLEEESDSSNSQSDSSFDILEETRSRISNLSIKKKKLNRRLPKVSVSISSDSDTDYVEAGVPEFDKNDEKTYEDVQKIIQGGQVEKLKVDQCKIYLRKHNLRLTGIKGILIKRIKEHLDVINGGGERKYPVSSFVLNCKGDACTGDVVLFEQKVYEMYSIVSRSATGPPCGTRMIAGRIVKESYGSAKQQHTFTIEVLWSKGERPVPPLHPLLIKGRNLYKLNTQRQIWDDEGQRQKILEEKHSRGYSARANREMRVQRKEASRTIKTTARASQRIKPIQEQVVSAKENNHTTHSSYRQPSGSSYVSMLQPHYVPPPLRESSTNIEKSIQNTQHASDRQSSSSSYQGLLGPPFVHPPYPLKNIPYGMPQRQNHFVPHGMYRGQQHTKKEVCRDFKRGNCYYGEKCKYLH